MFRVLKVILCSNAITGILGISAKSNIFIVHLRRGSPNFTVRTVTVICAV